MQTPRDALDREDLPKGERRRRSLLEAALRVIARGGVEAVTHRRVAAEAGVSHGATTYHFASRDEIILQAFRYYIRLNTAHLDAALFELDDDLDRDEVDVRSIVAFLVDFTRREFADPELVLAEYEMILYAARNETLAREYRAWQRSLVGGMATVLEACGAPRPSEAARVVVAVCRAFELEQLTHPRTSPSQLERRLNLFLPSLVERSKPLRMVRAGRRSR
jgi:DNA-binding transcriptional regulator YbjK